MINIYCDESNHLLKSPSNTGDTMVIGATSCPFEDKDEIFGRIREIKEKHGVPSSFEAKWTKVSPQKEELYLELINFFFDYTSLSFRAIIIDKSTLDHQKFEQTHDEWYYKMYFLLLGGLLLPNEKYNIYLDIKDTRGGEKVRKLDEVLRSSKYDFNRQIVSKIQQIRSQESEIVQITDLLIGALQHKVKEGSSATKEKLISKIRERSGYNLEQSTLKREKKFNLFFWEGNSNGETE